MNESLSRLPMVGHSRVEREGIAILSTIVHMEQVDGGLGWLFREVAALDFGIDGQIEVAETSETEDVRATGKLLSVQVKAGASYFKNENGDAWVVYIPKRNVRYWHSHSLPVLIVLVDPKSKECYWVRGDADHEETGDSYRVRVPKHNVLDRRAVADLRKMAENTSDLQRRLGYLQADVPIMLAALGGAEIVMDVSFWINKSSGRCDYTIGYRDWNVDSDPRFMNPITQGSSFSRGDVLEMAAHVVPWADAEGDAEFEEAMCDDLYEDYLAEHGTWDSEDGRYIDSVGIFDSWLAQRRRDDVLIAYEAGGEIESYRLFLKPNDLARSFAVVQQYLAGDWFGESA